MTGHADLPISLLLSSVYSRYNHALESRKRVLNSDQPMPMKPNFEDLFDGIECEAKWVDGESPVTCLITDSRRVVPGALFFAL